MIIVGFGENKDWKSVLEVLKNAEEVPYMVYKSLAGWETINDPREIYIGISMSYSAEVITLKDGVWTNNGGYPIDEEVE